MCGPLALLALAWRGGVRVAGQDEAIARIMALLMRWRAEDSAGPYWPRWVTGDHLRDPAVTAERGPDAWCYGTAGVARTIYLAGLALARDDWQMQAHAVLDGAIAAASDRVISDHALCHGWSGLLHIAIRMWLDTGRAAYRNAVSMLADRVMSGYGSDLAFGFGFPANLAGRTLDRPGLLDGAAGIALALSAHASGAAPATPWDSALLLA